MLNSKFPDTLWFVVFFGLFWRNFTTIREICIHVPYKFAQSGYIPPKVKFRISNPRRLPYTQTWVKYPPPPPPGFRRRILFATCTDADFDFKLHVLPPRIFKRSGSSADAEIVEGVRPNQEPLSLSARIFFFP